MEIAVQYNDGYAENIFAFAEHHQHSGWREARIFPASASALTRTINYYANQTGMLKEQKDESHHHR